MIYPFIDKKNPLILASASARRKDRLTQVGLPFETKISHMDEKKSYGDPEQTACLLAEKKACDVYPRVGKSWVLGADTVVVVDSATELYWQGSCAESYHECMKGYDALCDDCFEEVSGG